jgi:hypothetical protein
MTCLRFPRGSAARGWLAEAAHLGEVQFGGPLDVAGAFHTPVSASEQFVLLG